MRNDYVANQELREKVQEAVTAREPKATKDTTKLSLAIDRFILGPVFYAEWDCPEDEIDDCFCYALVHKEVEIYDDGVQLVQRMKQILDERRSIFQRVGEFTWNDLIGAIIALSMTGAFLTTMFSSVTTVEVNKEFLALVMLIAGYYFGKSK